MKHISLTNLVLDNAAAGDAGIDFIRRKKPAWLRAKLPAGPGFRDTRNLVDRYQLHTVCESAKCPNLGECWERGTATMMILGDVCTRACGFCNIKTGRPPEYDLDEPRRVGEAAALMGLRHLVMTSVNRDELPDGGAEIWAETIREIRRQSPGTSVEVLIPDFCGDWDALQIVLDERPDILNHNLETVPRLYKVVRPQAIYQRSIELLRRGKAQGLTVKTGIMVGIGEREDEVLQLMHDLVDGVRVPGIADDNPATNRDACDTPDPYRMVPTTPGTDASPDTSTNPDTCTKPGASRRDASGSATTTSPGSPGSPGSLHDNVGLDKPGPGHALRRGGDLVDHANPYWPHHAPTPPPENLAQRRAEKVAFPHATYPGIHETCDILTIGQYLQPTRNHLPISHWVTPAQFVEYKRQAERIGLRHCESGPLVRSSYHADEQVLHLDRSPATTS